MLQSEFDAHCKDAYYDPDWPEKIHLQLQILNFWVSTVANQWSKSKIELPEGIADLWEKRREELKNPKAKVDVNREKTDEEMAEESIAMISALFGPPGG